MEFFYEVLVKSSLDYEYNSFDRNTINFFICSAFQDFEIERKLLSTRIFPKLQERCFQQFGIHIKLIDLKIGLDAVEEMSGDFQQLFINSIGKYAACNETVCPILFFGQKFGHPLVPKRIPLQIFELFKTTMRRRRNQFYMDYKSLDVYYQLDANSEPPEMFLTNPRVLFPELQSNNPDEVEIAREKWRETKSLLNNVFVTLYKLILMEESLEGSDIKKIFIFELDSLISSVVRNSISSSFVPIIFSREIIDIMNFIEISNRTNDDKRKSVISKFIDVHYDSDQMICVNDYLKRMLEICKTSCFDLFEDANDTVRILWRDDTGVNELHHKNYLEQFSVFFEQNIMEAVKERNERLVDDFSPTVLKYFDFIADANCKIRRFAKMYWGYEEIINALVAYVNDDSVNEPMMLYGPLNSGKAIIISRTIIEIQNSMNVYCIIRYANDSDTISDILKSVYFQMRAIVLNNSDQLKWLIAEMDVNNFINDFTELFEKFQNETNQTFLIILHDLEKCLTQFPESYLLSIIPKMLPKNIKLIVTCRGNWNSRKPDLLNIATPQYTVIEYNNYCRLQLFNTGRQLTEEQWQCLPNLLKCVDDVWSADVAASILKKLKSSDDISQLLKVSNKIELINLILLDLILNFGETLITHIICFLYCSRNGLTDDEMVDLLTLDVFVVNDQKLKCPNSIIIDQDKIRFSSAFWSLIRQEMSLLLFERIKDGHILNILATDSIFDCVKNLGKFLDLEFFHKILSEYYLGTWTENKKPFQDFSYFCLPKPQTITARSGQKFFYNYRKFRQTVRHLVESGLTEALLKDVIFNFDWLYNKIKCVGLNELLEDFVISRSGGKEIILLEESLRNAANIIEKDLDSLAGELIGQLLPYVSYYPNLRYLIENCDCVAPKHNAFIPIYPSEKLPGSPLASTISCPSSIDSVMVIVNPLTNNEELLLKIKDDSRVYFYDLNMGEIVSEIFLSHGEIYFGENKNIVLILESRYKQVIKVHQLDSGDLLGQIIPMNWIVSRPFEERIRYQIQSIDVGKTKVGLIFTNEVSYLFIVSLEKFEPLLVFNPGVKLQLLKLSFDEMTVFTHHEERLINLDVKNNQLNSAVELQGIPIEMKFSAKVSGKAFIICKKQKGVIVVDLDKNNAAQKCYKISFDNCLESQDSVKQVIPSEIGNPYLLIRSCNSVLLYDWVREKVLCHVTRPSQLPVYFKLPNQSDNQPACLEFNAASLILSDKAIACALFRDIIICSVSDSKVLTTLHAPVGGIVSQILISNRFLIGRIDQTKESAEVLIWKNDTSSLFSRLEAPQDRLTKSVSKILVGPTTAIATADNSDEMGVFEISSGTLVDLYSHASRVIQSCISACGKWALVTVANEHNANILWSLESRKIVMEFGSSSSTAFVIPLQSASGFLCISNHSVSIDNPNFIVTQITCDDRLRDSALDDKSFALKMLDIKNLNYLFYKPILLENDSILVFLPRHYKQQEEYMSVEGFIAVWSRSSSDSTNGSMKVVNISDISTQINLPIESLVFCEKYRDYETIIFFNDVHMNRGVFIFNCQSLTVIQYLLFSSILPYDLDFKTIHLSDSGTYIFDELSHIIVDISNGHFVGSFQSEFKYSFQCFALRDSVIVLSQHSKLFAWRLPELTKIGQVELKEKITCVAKCSDDFTLLIGSVDGSVISYAVIDIFSPNECLSNIRVVRNFQSISRTSSIHLESDRNNLNAFESKSKLSDEMMFNFADIKRPMSDPVVRLERKEFSDIL